MNRAADKLEPSADSSVETIRDLVEEMRVAKHLMSAIHLMADGVFGASDEGNAFAVVAVAAQAKLEDIGARLMVIHNWQEV